MVRIKFRKNKQRKFIKEVLDLTGCPTLKELSNRLGISYSTLKNYYNESRNLPEDLFNDLCFISGIKSKSFNYQELNENWGQVIGGKKSKR